MRRTLLILLAVLMALPMCARGEGMNVPVEAFIARAGIEADEALKSRIEAFLRERFISAPVLDMMDDARLHAYARHLAEDLPIAYPDLMDGSSEPMPEGAAIRQAAVLWPQGAAMESLLVDFERGLVYYDETFPVPEDVCRAQFAGMLTDADRERLTGLLLNVPMEGRDGEPGGIELSAIRVAVVWDGGATRRVTGDADELFLESVRALLDAGRDAAQGDDT